MLGRALGPFLSPSRCTFDRLSPPRHEATPPPDLQLAFAGFLVAQVGNRNAAAWVSAPGEIRQTSRHGRAAS